MTDSYDFIKEMFDDDYECDFLETVPEDPYGDSETGSPDSAAPQGKISSCVALRNAHKHVHGLIKDYLAKRSVRATFKHEHAIIQVA